MSRLSRLLERVPWTPLALAALVFGSYGLVHALTSWEIKPLTFALAAGVAFVIAVVIWPRDWGKANVFVLNILGATLVAFLALAGVNVVTNELMEALELGSLSIGFGLVLAVGVFGFVAYWYLMGRGWEREPAKRVSGGLALVVILGAPWIVGEIKSREDKSPVPKPELLRSQLDVAIVSDGSRHPEPPPLPPNPALEELDVRYSVGYATDRDEVRWTMDGEACAKEVEARIAEGEEIPAGETCEARALTTLARGDGVPAGAAQPVPRPDADTVLLLLVDGTAPMTEDPQGLRKKRGTPEEVARWKRVAENAAPPKTPAYALLQAGQRRLDKWESFGSPGRAVSAQGYGSQTVTDAAVHLAIDAPTARADLILAMEYRPVLLFDHGESVPWPISVDALFRAGALTLCRSEGVTETGCGDDPLRRPAELENGGTHLQLDLEEFGDLPDRARAALKAQREEAASLIAGDTPPGAGSAIYVRPFSTTRDGEKLLYLDYWWYLPDNPVGVGGGALCGAGFVIPGVTCLGHQSDWEGMTVVVNRSDAKPRIEAVQYAQHDHVVRYDWGKLRAHWENLDKPKVEELLAEIPDADRRPLAFIAKGTHATYPTPCGACSQESKLLGEDPHRGDLGWVGNNTDACGKSSCLQMLPTRREGEEPALWNAYEGQWGERNCLLTYYCDSASPPTAPGGQDRYEDPTFYDNDRSSKLPPQP